MEENKKAKYIVDNMTAHDVAEVALLYVRLFNEIGDLEFAIIADTIFKLSCEEAE